MKNGLWLVLLLFAVSGFSAPSGPPPSLLQDRDDRAVEEDYRVLSDIPYGPHERQLLDLYLANDAERLGSGNLTIVFLHGGGFSFGQKSHNQRYIKGFLSRGLNVVNVNYRIREGIPAATEDLSLALNYLRTHNQDWGLRLDRIVAGGFSAGGQIASTVGFSQGYPDYPYPLDDGIRVVAVLNIAGPVDGLDLIEEVFAGSDDEGFQTVAQNLFPPHSAFSREETLKLFMPFVHFTDEAPAYFLWHGGQDDQVPASTFAAFLAALAESPVPHRVLFDPEWGHSPTATQLDEIFVELFRFLDDVRR